MADTQTLHTEDRKTVPPRPSTVLSQIGSASVDGGKGKEKGKAPLTNSDKKKQAQDMAAHRELLLSSRNNAYVLNYLERRTYFDKDQIRALQRIYRCFKGSYQMDRLRYREMVASILGITDSMLLDRIFQAFDSDNEGSVSETEWIIGLSVQLKGELEHQIAYAYDVYDVNGDRSIGREEISSFYRNSIYPLEGILEPEEVDDATNELIELAMKKFDLNKDGNIHFPEFRHVVRRDPLLLEAFGECLPKERATMPFVSLLDTNSRNYKSYLSCPSDVGWSRERKRYDKLQSDQGMDDLSIAKNDLSEAPAAWSSLVMTSNVPPISSPKKKVGTAQAKFKPKRKHV